MASFDGRSGDEAHTLISTALRTSVRFAGAEDADAILRFNGRLRAAGYGGKGMPIDPALPGEARHRPAGFPVHRRLMLASSGQEVRAALLLLHNTLFLRGVEQDFCWLQRPLSEGLVDRKHALAIVQLVKSALAYQPFMLELGVGSLEEDWSRFLIKMGWKYAAVPFLFCPLRATRVLLGLEYLKSRPRLHWASCLAAYCGMGIGLSGFTALRRRLAGSYGQGSPEQAFDDWADRVFARSVGAYGGLARRDATTLNILYPPEDRRFTRLRVRCPGTQEDRGWVVVIDTPMRNHPYFGDLRVGTLVDGLAQPADVSAVVATGLRYLVDRGVDLVVANWSHRTWVRASWRLGFLPGPSNYYFSTAPGTSPLLSTACPLADIHLTRGDCDGPEHLLGPPVNPEAGIHEHRHSPSDSRGVTSP